MRTCAERATGRRAGRCRAPSAPAGGPDRVSARAQAASGQLLDARRAGSRPCWGERRAPRRSPGSSSRHAKPGPQRGEQVTAAPGLVRHDRAQHVLGEPAQRVRRPVLQQQRREAEVTDIDEAARPRRARAAGRRRGPRGRRPRSRCRSAPGPTADRDRSGPAAPCSMWARMRRSTSSGSGSAGSRTTWASSCGPDERPRVRPGSRAHDARPAAGRARAGRARARRATCGRARSWPSAAARSSTPCGCAGPPGCSRSPSRSPDSRASTSTRCRCLSSSSATTSANRSMTRRSIGSGAARGSVTHSRPGQFATEHHRRHPTPGVPWGVPDGRRPGPPGSLDRYPHDLVVPAQARPARRGSVGGGAQRRPAAAGSPAPAPWPAPCLRCPRR